MLRYFLIATVLCFLFFSPNLSADDPGGNQQRLKTSLPRAQYFGQMKLSEDFFDFGYMPGHSKASHIFYLKNVGIDTLEIKRIQPGCGCTKTPLRKRLIAVDDSARIEIIFSSGRYRGPVSKSPRLYTSDQRMKEKSLRFQVYVLYDEDTSTQHQLEIAPFEVHAIIGQEKEEYPVTVKNITDETLEMSLVSHDPEVMEITLPEKVEPGKKAQIALKLKNLDTYKIPGFGKSFTIELLDEENTRYTIPVVYEKSKDASAGH
jgi:hypothetical protein